MRGQTGAAADPTGETSDILHKIVGVTIPRMVLKYNYFSHAPGVSFQGLEYCGYLFRQISPAQLVWKGEILESKVGDGQGLGPQDGSRTAGLGQGLDVRVGPGRPPGVHHVGAV